MAATNTPPCKWAERKDKIYFTVEVSDLKTANVKLETSGALSFEAGKYKLTTELLKEVDTAGSKWGVTARGVVFEIKKKEEGYWNKLVKEVRPRWLSVDWHRWKDEDEADEASADPGFDFNNMAAGGGFDMEGDGPMGEEEDENMPALEHDAPADAAPADAAPAPAPTSQ